MDNNLENLAKLLRYFSLVSTTEAGSGHPTSALSAADLMAVLCFGGFYRFDLNNPDFFNNDRLIFSKGHASPLFYSIYAAAGKVSEKEMLNLRQFGSKLEGHPTMEFPYTEVPTGSLGQGLSVGAGMAMNAKMDKLNYRTFVLLGDSEMAEGSVWEAMEIASHYKLDNLVGILDANRLGQRGETLYGHHLEKYQKKAEAFGWGTAVIEGHSLEEINSALEKAVKAKDKPFMIIAKTLKGKGVSFIEDKDGWHGKALSADELEKALEELGEIDKHVVGEIAKPAKISNFQFPISNQFSIPKFTNYKPDEKVATRKAYGNALANLVEANNQIVVLDAETSNSTYSESVKKTHPEKFVECFIAEQNMAGMALGFSRRGKIPFASTFAAFWSRAFDQIRMSQYANSNIKFVGSHAGVSIGEDGSSQMALEDIAMFRTNLGGVVLYPSDAVSTEKLVLEAAKHVGNVFIRTTRAATPIIYNVDDNFPIGGSKTVKSSDSDKATIIAAGITLHEALKAYEELQKEGINLRIIDLYSIKPLDINTLQKAAKETGVIITVEDHFPEGGIGEAVAGALCTFEVHHILESLAVRKVPHSGKPAEIMEYEEIDASAIIKKVKSLLNTD
ncbi:MAG: transketolase [Candidatus Doudnabacteria bacterium CG10_big_fil_rev_8_21_14_0_10_42_18]|uniref:Transketolase n=1 Tax=Candidatus Doudnabacteria bacterium CG10_big_fil_rev_8_21_14_0_10_42_18 TaxID=1974552 RepID=A0A2H0VC67_9BACT|nr:MAG: transketolase [Candidatus Doudnabacteria bacterium CG10_big_fil_rev_8_21_14_0_10_42_18]